MEITVFQQKIKRTYANLRDELRVDGQYKKLERNCNGSLLQMGKFNLVRSH